MSISAPASTAERPRDPAADDAALASGDSFVRITPRGIDESGFIGDLRELWANRRIIAALVQRQLRLRYKGSFLGIFWSMAPPIIQVAVLTVVLNFILGSGPKNLSAYMFCAFIPWIFISNTLLDGSSSVLMELGIMKKSYFPREVLPIASVCANFVHFCVALCVFLVYRYVLTTLIFGWPGFPPREILMLPFVIVDMLLLTTGLTLMLSAWTTFYEDVKYAVSSGLQLLFYALPIIYFAEQIFFSPHGGRGLRWWVYHIYLANPLAWIVTSFKQMFFSVQVISQRLVNVHGTPTVVAISSAPFDYRYYALTTVTSLIIFVLGYREFKRLRWKFVERP